MLIVIVASIVCGVGLLVLSLRTFFVVGEPNEWLLKISNGSLQKCGVGISCFRWPWERVVRFTATNQRVAFSSAGLSSETQPVAVQGFVLWSVSPQGTQPFDAFCRLGIVTADADRPVGNDRDHLLSGTQYRAFQSMISAIVEQSLVTLSLRELMTAPDTLRSCVRRSLIDSTQGLGIAIHDLQLLQVRPQDPQLLCQLSAELAEEAREQAAKRRIAADEEIKQRELLCSQNIAMMAASNEQSLRLVEEENARIHQEAIRSRLREELTHELEQQRLRAQTERELAKLAAEVEQDKSDEVRAHELARLRIEAVTQAFGKLPIKQAHWLTLGNSSPLASLAKMLE